MTGLRHALLVAGREAGAERRQPDGLVASLTFITTLLLIESLAIGPADARRPAVAAALFWIALLFAALFAATRSFDRELEDDAVDAILPLDGGRDALYLGKVLALAGLLGIVAVGGGLLSLVMLDLAVASPLRLIVTLLAGVIALPPVVVLNTMLVLRLRGRGVLVPILSLPILVPMLLAATQGTASALSGDATTWLGWTGLLVAFSLVYGVLGLTIVPTATE